MSIEDEIFSKDLEAMTIKRTQLMYRKADLPHKCNMCLDDNETNTVGYALKLEYVTCLDTPYLFICKDCYESLPKGEQDENI